MNPIDATLAEISQEAATARRLLERVPAQHLAWKPHEKSMTMGRLATHIAEIPGWVSTSTTAASSRCTCASRTCRSPRSTVRPPTHPCDDARPPTSHQDGFPSVLQSSIPFGSPDEENLDTGRRECH